MLNVRAFFAALLLTLISSQVMADAASHAAAAKQLLKLVNANQIAGPWYGQVNQMFAQRFAETQSPESKKAVRELSGQGQDNPGQGGWLEQDRA